MTEEWTSMRLLGAFLVLAMLWTGQSVAQEQSDETAAENAASATSSGVAQLERMTARFAPTPLRVDVAGLAPSDRQALAKLVEAARIFDIIFLKQLWSGNLALYERLKRDKTPLGQAGCTISGSTRDRGRTSTNIRRFCPASGAKAERSELLSREHDQSGIRRVGERADSGTAGTGQGIFYSDKTQSGRRGRGQKRGDGTLLDCALQRGVQGRSDAGSGLLKEAAALTENTSLKKFLTMRADAFLSNDYYESDMAWMDLDAPIDITIGPYETYNDELFGYKAAFEAYVNLRDERESSKLSVFTSHCSRSKTICRSIRSTAIRSWERRRRYAW